MSHEHPSPELKSLYRKIVSLQAESADEFEIRAAKATAHAALCHRSDEILDSIAEVVRNDKRIQGLLVDMFLAQYVTCDPRVHPNRMSGRVRWEQLIEHVFTCPDDDAINAREASFRKAYGVPILDSVGIADA